jgi:hypothetical protein
MAQEHRDITTEAWVKELQNRLEAIGARLADVGELFERSAKAREVVGREFETVVRLLAQLDHRLASVCAESNGAADRPACAADSAPVVYREVPDFPGYRVSDDGTIWGSRRAGRGYGRSREWRALKPYLVRPGPAPTVSLYRDRVRHSRRVAEVVLLAFVGPCPHGSEICHENGDLFDNRIGNLRYAPAREAT